MSCPRSHREWQSWKETRVSRPQFLCNKQESDTLQADAWAILNSLHFLFSHKDKPTLKWAAWGSCWWSQLMVTSFSVCWLITGISSCPVNCCESRDGSSRLSNSHHQPWLIGSGYLEHDIEKDAEAESRLSGKEWQCLWGQEKGMCAHPWTLTCPGVSCSPPEFFWV